MAKCLCLVLVALCLNSAAASWFNTTRTEYYGETEARMSFKIWQMEHGKYYRKWEETEERFQYFHDNLKRIIDLNKQYREEEVTFAPNQFADMTIEEFKRKILMPAREAPKHDRSKYLEEPEELSPLPESFDWVTKNVVTSVKNQGSAGSCWAFSTIENIEGQWSLMKKNLSADLSVEQVVECDNTKDLPKNRADCGIFGGWPYMAFQYLIKQGGIEKDSDYPYCSGGGGKPGTCFPCQPPGFNKTLCGMDYPPWCNTTCAKNLDKSKFVPGLQLEDWRAVPENETVMAELLMKVGPFSIALNASPLMFYTSGVFDPFVCNPKELDHAVLMTGWGVHKGYFKTKPYWIIKNSWGPKWGINGYFWILRGKGKCGVNTAVTTAVLKK